MLESLLQQREELLEQIRRIAETCEGIKNEANARRVTELNGRQAELLAHEQYTGSNSYAEVKTLIEKTNSDSWGGFNDWKIPTPFEFWKMIEDKSFPFRKGSYWYIKGRGGWCVNNNGSLRGKSLYYSGATNELYSNGYVHVIPCSHALLPTNSRTSTRKFSTRGVTIGRRNVSRLNSDFCRLSSSRSRAS